MRAVVSANLARIAFPGMPFESVVGQRMSVLARRNSREIIGVVGDATIDVYGKPTSAVYSAHRQFAGNRNWALTQVVATDGPPETMLPAVRAVVAAMDPELVVYRAASMDEIVGRGASRERFALVLMGTFAGVSLTLAAIGLYGVLAYAVRQRTPEIGIRMALGATGREVRSLVLRQAAPILGAGLIVGTAGALVLGRWLSSLVYSGQPVGRADSRRNGLAADGDRDYRGVVAGATGGAGGAEAGDAGSPIDRYSALKLATGSSFAARERHFGDGDREWTAITSVAVDIIDGPYAARRGTRLGMYEVLAAIGAGGMGEVYHARDTRLGRDVAVKSCRPHLQKTLSASRGSSAKQKRLPR